jgi:hypothetical protein
MTETTRLKLALRWNRLLIRSARRCYNLAYVIFGLGHKLIDRVNARNERLECTVLGIEVGDLARAEKLEVAVGEMPETTIGELNSLGASISKVDPSTIPLGEGIDIDAIKAGDDDPYEVAVEIRTGKSKRGWNYTRAALEKIAGEVKAGGLPGYKGHLKPDEVAHRFEDPATHWVGVKQEGDRFIFRGVVDAAQANLKRLIRAGRITQVSIFGTPTLQRSAGETLVVDYDPISIDWTPLKRAGMPTAIVGVGEIDSITEPGKEPPNPRGAQDMDLKELLAELRKVNATPQQVIGEMQWSPEDVVAATGATLDKVGPALDKDGFPKLIAAGEMVTKLAEAYGEQDADKLLARIEDDRKAAESGRGTEHEKLVDKVIGEKVTGEMAQTLVKDMLKVEATATEEQIATAIGEVLEKKHVKAALKNAHGEINVGGSGGGGTDPKGTKQPTGLKKRTVSI